MLRLNVRAGLVVLMAGLSSHAVLASAPTKGFSFPRSHATVTSNASVYVTWTLPRALDAEEMELVLSLDGGETFPVRVTREMEPTAKSVVWRVPNLPTNHARLALRADVDGRETLLFRSPEFAIAPEPARPLEEVVEVGGELHTKDAVEAKDASTLPEGGLRPAGDRISSADRDEPLDDSGSFLLPVQPPVLGVLLGDVAALPSSQIAAQSGARVSLPKRE